jgi:superfamily II DNA/RNA helicase
MWYCRSCELIQTMITGVGLESVALHSRLSQAHRLRALNRFKSSRARILVATDVGSRCAQMYTWLLG